jgi:Lrp/AsnC family transcriptional regulator, leucine-responsive regulatory protein
MMTVDVTDERILDLLRNDARLPVAAVAKEVGLSRPAVAERIRHLEAAGLIRGYTAVVDPSVRGEVVAFISGRRGGAFGEREERALQELSKVAEIEELHHVAGEDCFLMKIRARDISALHKVVRMLHEPPLGFETKTTIALSTYFEKVGGVLLENEREG